MDMRIEFEAAMAKQLSSEGYSDFSIEMMFERGSDDEYRSIRVNGAYWGWQSARESLVITLPDRANTRVDCGGWPLDSGSHRVNGTIDKCKDAIHALGIRTK